MYKRVCLSCETEKVIFSVQLEIQIPFSTMPEAAAGPFGNTSRTYVEPFSTFILIPRLPRCLVKYTVNIRENGSLQGNSLEQKFCDTYDWRKHAPKNCVDYIHIILILIR